MNSAGELAQVLAAHGVRIGHCERSIEDFQAAAQGAALAGQAVSIADLGRRLDKQEAKMTGLRNWLIGVLATSTGSLAMLLWQQLTK